MYTLLGLCEKDVVTLTSGTRLGRVDDLKFDEYAKIHNIIVFGKLKFFGLLGKEPDIYIRWADIAKIGKDVVLVKYEPQNKDTEK